MTIRHLRIFIEVAKLGNMSKAANNLFVSQPTVSQAIKELEDYYGILLFERLNKRLYITDLGKKLYFHAKKLVDDFDVLEETMANINKIQEIKIGATVTIGDCILSDILKRYTDTNPNVKVCSYVGNTEYIENRLLANELDIAIVEGKIKSSDLVVRPELNDYLVLICNSDHPFAKKKDVKIEELVGQNFAMREEGSGTRELFEEFLHKHNIPISTVFIGNSPEAIKREVIENDCLSVISICLVEREVKDGDIHIIKSEGKEWNRHFSTVYHKDKVISDVMKSLIKITKNYEYIPDTMDYEPGLLIK